MNNTETNTDTLLGTDRTGALDDLSPPTKLAKFEVKKPKPKPGQPSKFNTRTANVMLRALRAGLTHAQACRATGIARETLHAWMDKHPDFRVAVEAARDEARRDALEDIKASGQEDWKALAQWLRLAFPEYRKDGPTFHVSANAQAGVLCTEEQRQEIIAMRAKLLSRSGGSQRGIEHSVGIPADSDRAGSSDLTTDGEYVKVEESERT